MNRASVHLHDYKAGTLTEDENGYTFLYDKDFLESTHAEAISLTMPLTDKPYQDKVLFPFFDGLIPEGWLLNIAEKAGKSINETECLYYWHVVKIALEQSA